jgi:hypothetical protein
MSAGAHDHRRYRGTPQRKARAARDKKLLSIRLTVSASAGTMKDQHTAKTPVISVKVGFTPQAHHRSFSSAGPDHGQQ